MARFFDTEDGKSLVANRRQKAGILVGRRKLALLESDNPSLTQVRAVFDVAPGYPGMRGGWPTCLLAASDSGTCREISKRQKIR